MTLSQDLNNLIDKCKTKRIVKVEELQTILQDVQFDPRLKEDNNSIDEILDEFVNQSLIWIDDESFQGDLTYLKKLILVLEEPLEELLEKHKNLIDLLQTSSQNLDLCKGMKQDLIHEFHILGWITTRTFLESLGLTQMDLNDLENLQENQDRISQGLEIFLMNHIPPELVSSDRELTQYVIDKLNQTKCKRTAQKLAEKYL